MTLTAPAPATTVHTVNASALTADNVGDRIEFSQDNGFRGGIVTAHGTIDSASRYRPMFELARVVIDGELYAIRYETPVTVTRAPGKPPTRAVYVPPAPKAARSEPRTVFSGAVQASALPHRIGWNAELRTPDGVVTGIVADAYRAGDVIVTRIGDLWGEIALAETVIVSRRTADDTEDPE